MSPFLKAAESRALAMREEKLLTTPGRCIPAGLRETYGTAADRASRDEMAKEREQVMRQRTEAVQRLRKLGLSMPEVAERLSLSWRQVQLAAKRAAS